VLSGLKNPIQPYARLKVLHFSFERSSSTSDCKITPALHKAQLRSSHEAKSKALLSAISEAAIASLSVEKALSYKVRAEAPCVANSKATSLEGKALSAQIASYRGEAMTSARKPAFKAKFRAKPKTFQPIWANFLSP